MAITSREDTIREELINLLEQDKIDADQLMQLSSALAQTDEENVRFSIDATLISRLGRELVARQETAVSELIKNAYDADARTVTLIFSQADEPGGRLEVIDDGLGMTREQLVEGFMRLASDEKVREPISPKYKRQRAGRKGIGRFATQRLGQKLTITTQAKEALAAYRIEIDWSAFAAGQDLTSISSHIITLPKRDATGTILMIDGLRESWSEPEIKRVYRYIADLLQPFPLSEENEGHKDDPGFKVRILIERDGQFTEVADERTEIFSHALAEISAHVDRRGVGEWSIRSKRLGIQDEVTPVGKTTLKAPFAALRNISFKAYYFIYESNLIPRSQLKTIRDLAKDRGGIRVYRNGFRVPPYGDLDDDWLGLDALSRARSFLLPIANINFFGFVEITDVEGECFEETSSREGLMNNQAFRELQDFLLRVLKAAATRVGEARNKKKTAGQKDYHQDDPGVIVTKSIKAVEKLARDLVVAGQKTEAKQLKDVSRQLKMAATVQSEVVEELAMLRVLASLGLSIGEFTHEVQQTLHAALLNARHLKDVVSQVQDTDSCEIASDLLSNIQRFQAYATYFQKTVSDNVVRELEPQNLATVVRDFISTVEAAANSVGICIEPPDIIDHGLITCPMHPSEWSSILFNFYTNARKAIARASVEGRIALRVWREAKTVFLEFLDNGDGIPEENKARVFNAFFTTTGPKGRFIREEDELQGTGLGLKIVKDIIVSYNGKVYVSSPSKPYSTAFRVELPAATREEMEAYGY